MQNTNNQPFFVNSVQQSPNEVETSQSVPQNVNINTNQSRSVSQSSINQQQQLQQQQYAAYIQQQQQQRYYAQQQQYLIQQQRQQYASYWHSVVKQRQQHQYAHYYQQIAQQYGYPAMVQAINQNHQNINHNHTINRNGGPIILSSEEQPLLIASDNNSKYKRRRRKRKRKTSEIDNEKNEINNDETSNDPSNDNDDNYIRNETVSIDIQDDDVLGLDKDGYDKHTLINQNECLPDINTEFAEWLYFTKKLWRRQKKYKNHVIFHDNDNKTSKTNKKNNCNTNVFDLTDSFTTSDDSSPCDTLQIKSAFLKDRARMKFNKQKVLKNKSVINIMIKMGLAPPWNEMSKYKKWIKCYKWNQANDSNE